MKKLIFSILLFLLLLPKLQEQLNIFTFIPLSGVTVSTDSPTFGFKQWFDGSYQNNYSTYKDQTFGLRNFFIRLFNQFDYSLFSYTHVNVVVGKHGYLFQGGYIDEVTGASFVGDDIMKKNVKNIHLIENYLNKKGIFLLTVLAPGKTDYYKEYLPDYYSKRLSDKRNYTSFLKYSQQENIRYIDLNKWILQAKDTSKYPLFPKQGIHWNYYCMALSADTMVKYIEKEKNIKLQKLSWSLEFPNNLRGTDYDLGDLMNIFWKPSYDKMPYPQFSISNDSLIHKPRLLVIADSFYWTIFSQDVFSKIFSDQTYYYYFSSVNPKERALSSFVSDLNILQEVEKYDIVLLLQSSANYGNPGVNFVQGFTNALDQSNEYQKKEIGLIKGDKFLSGKILEIEKSKNISADSAISILSDSITRFHFNEISRIKIQMRQNPEWIHQLYDKATSTNTPIEQIMQSDAEWVLSQQKK